MRSTLFLILYVFSPNLEERNKGKINMGNKSLSCCRETKQKQTNKLTNQFVHSFKEKQKNKNLKWIPLSVMSSQLKSTRLASSNSTARTSRPTLRRMILNSSNASPVMLSLMIL